MRSTFLLASFLLIVLAVSSFGADSFYLKNGDRVVFYGDSITDQRLYTVITETYVATRYPKLDVTFVHSGWGGDKVSGAGRPHRRSPFARCSRVQANSHDNSCSA